MTRESTKRDADVRTLAVMHASDIFEGVDIRHKMTQQIPLHTQAARMIHMAVDLRRTNELIFIY